MASFNQTVLVGNLTRDPEMRFTPAGAAVANFGIAVNKKWKDKQGQPQESVSYFDIEAWARLAELVNEYCRKGSPVLISGELEQKRWEDQSSGQSRSRVVVKALNIQFLGGRDQEQQPQQAAPGYQQPVQEVDLGDDIPF